jgi:erythronate-4-phosphate dehydrogenase
MTMVWLLIWWKFFALDELGFDYTQKTLGIIGVGNVGSRLAAKAELMGIKTLLNDPPRQDTENLPEFVELGAALSADIVTFHTPLSFGFLGIVKT